MKYPHRVRLTWERNPRWNEICAWGIEHLGLPGDRFQTEVCEDWMEWRFQDINDQLMFVVAWGDDTERKQK